MMISQLEQKLEVNKNIMACKLCELIGGKVKTELYYWDDDVVIVDCEQYRIPMLVFKRHGSANREQKRYALNIIDTLFDHVGLRKTPRKIKDHEHWHIFGAKMKEVQ